MVHHPHHTVPLRLGSWVEQILFGWILSLHPQTCGCYQKRTSLDVLVIRNRLPLMMGM